MIPAYFPSWGGAENQARKQAIELVARGHEVQVTTWRRDPALPDIERLDGVTVRRIDRFGSSLVGAIRSFLTMGLAVSQGAAWADVVVAHQMLSTAYLAGAAAALTRTPVAVVPAGTAARPGSDLGIHGGRSLVARLRYLCTWPLRWTGAAVGISRDIVADLLRLGFHRVVWIPNGVHDPGVPDRDGLRSELYRPLGIGSDARVAAAAGRFVPVKGFDVLLDAWAVAQQELPAGAVLLIVGSGPEEQALRRQAGQLGIEDSVRLVPASSRAADYLAAADAAVIPSRSEGLSNVLIESMAAGVPVVATAVSGNVDLIQDGETGRLLPADDSPALGSALVQALSAPGEMGSRGRQAVLARCELGTVVTAYEALFTSLGRLPPGSYSAEQLIDQVAGQV